ncbi:UDP-N-acetylmuramoyl-tripeptide--D-alanyl-D-alanine ligase [candidate division WOR-3 bacterium]|nr:UDP-N-acetylmuramoyl-tripeptide--D-alanyl-D-alanine ligase [candidate division WOR-3 bacterium]
MVESIAAMVDGRTELGGRELIRGVSIDSRDVQPGDIFFALHGERTDGHKYTRDAVERGAFAVVVDQPTGCDREITVDDTLYALGSFARNYRQRCISQRAKTIAVTGTNGKTTVKNAITAILSTHHHVLSSHKNYNSLIGLPLTLFDLEPHHEYVVLEMGTSRPGEIARLCEIAQPDIGVITLIGPGHLQDLGSLQGVLKEKLSLVDALPADGSAFIGEGVGDIRGKNMSRIDRSLVFNIEITEHGSSFTYQGHRFTTPLLGPANVYNCLIALCVTEHIGMTVETQHQALMAMEPQPGRLEPLEREGVLFINDTYNANPLSMRAAIEFAVHIQRPRIFILGDMLELGVQAKHLHEEIGVLAQGSSDLLVTYGQFARYYGGQHFGDKRELVRFVIASLSGNELILVKASRGLRFEDIIDIFLEEL